MSDLTVKQEAFALAHVEIGNASEAYRRAYDAAEMSAEAIHVEASRLLAHPKVALRIEELQAAQRRRHAITVDRILAEYTKVAFADAGDILSKVRSQAALAELTADERAIIAEVSETTTEHGGSFRVKLYSKMDALEKLARHLGIFEKDNEQAGKAAGQAAGEAIGEALTDIERARRVAFILDRAAHKMTEDPPDAAG